MAISTKESNLEEDIEATLCSLEGDYLKCGDRHSLLYIEDGAKYRAMMNVIGQLLVEKFR